MDLRSIIDEQECSLISLSLFLRSVLKRSKIEGRVNKLLKTSRVGRKNIELNRYSIETKGKDDPFELRKNILPLTTVIKI